MFRKAVQMLMLVYYYRYSADVFASPTKPALAGVLALPASTGRRSRLSADIGRESWFRFKCNTSSVTIPLFCCRYVTA